MLCTLKTSEMLGCILWTGNSKNRHEANEWLMQQHNKKASFSPSFRIYFGFGGCCASHCFQNQVEIQIPQESVDVSVSSWQRAPAEGSCSTQQWKTDAGCKQVPNFVLWCCVFPASFSWSHDLHSCYCCFACWKSWSLAQESGPRPSHFISFQHARLGFRAGRLLQSDAQQHEQNIYCAPRACRTDIFDKTWFEVADIKQKHEKPQVTVDRAFGRAMRAECWRRAQAWWWWKLMVASLKTTINYRGKT